MLRMSEVPLKGSRTWRRKKEVSGIMGANTCHTVATSTCRNVNLSECQVIRAGLLRHTRSTRMPHGGVRPFNRKSTFLTQSTGEPCVVQSRPCHLPKFMGNETIVAYRVVAEFGVEVPGFAFRISSLEAELPKDVRGD